MINGHSSGLDHYDMDALVCGIGYYEYVDHEFAAHICDVNSEKHHPSCYRVVILAVFRRVAQDAAALPPGALEWSLVHARRGLRPVRKNENTTVAVR